MHGNYETMKCLQCNTTLKSDTSLVRCPCSGIYRPNVVLFGGTLPPEKVKETYTRLKSADYVLVIGTTLAFGYLREFIKKSKMRGASVIHINPDDDYKSRVKENETWIKKNSYEGLSDLI